MIWQQHIEELIWGKSDSLPSCELTILALKVMFSTIFKLMVLMFRWTDVKVAHVSSMVQWLRPWMVGQESQVLKLTLWLTCCETSQKLVSLLEFFNFLLFIFCILCTLLYEKAPSCPIWPVLTCEECCISGQLYTQENIPDGALAPFCSAWWYFPSPEAPSVAFQTLLSPVLHKIRDCVKSKPLLS